MQVDQMKPLQSPPARWLAALVLALCTGSTQAFDPDHLQQLLTERTCRGCDLRDADLRNLDLSGVQLENADMRGARLAGSTLAGASLRGALLTGVQLYDVRLTGADLRNADLTHMDIDRDLEFVDLAGVLLEGARFSNGRRCGPLPRIGGWGCSHP